MARLKLISEKSLSIMISQVDKKIDERIKKKEEIHKLAEANKSYAHFSW